MLVLSRRPNEKILFPNLGISVEVRSVAKNAVRLGIEAPPSVTIVREEIATESEKTCVAEFKPTRHRIRNRMHTAGLAVHLAQKQLQAGMTKEAEISLSEALQEFSALDQELAAENSAPSKKPQRAIRALLVEDNYNECALLAEFLRLHGISVETASDGQHALDYLRSHERPDVVLLDMRMPRCDGPTTIAAIRRNAEYDGLKLFAVTGADRRECSVPSGDQGVDGWFTKPLNPAKLINEMNQVMGRN